MEAPFLMQMHTLYHMAAVGYAVIYVYYEVIAVCLDVCSSDDTIASASTIVSIVSDVYILPSSS